MMYGTETDNLVCVHAVMSRVSVVAGATIDGNLVDSNLGCTWVEFGSVSTLPMYEYES